MNEDQMRQAWEDRMDRLDELRRIHLPTNEELDRYARMQDDYGSIKNVLAIAGMLASMARGATVISLPDGTLYDKPMPQEFQEMIHAAYCAATDLALCLGAMPAFRGVEDHPEAEAKLKLIQEINDAHSQ